MAANKTDRLTIRSWPTGLWSNSSIKPLYCLPEDHAQGCWLSFFANSISGIGLFFAVVCLISCNGLATSGRSSTTSSANSLPITTANLPVATVQSGYSGSVTDTVQPRYGKIATAANAFSFATPTPTSAPSMPLKLAIVKEHDSGASTAQTSEWGGRKENAFAASRFYRSEAEPVSVTLPL